MCELLCYIITVQYGHKVDMILYMEELMENRGKILLSISVIIIVILTAVFYARIPVFGNSLNASYMKQLDYVSTETGDDNTITYKSKDKDAMISYKKDDRNDFIVNINGENSYKIDSDYIIYKLDGDEFSEIENVELINNNIQEYLLLTSVRNNFNIKDKILTNIIVFYMIGLLFIFNHKITIFVKNIMVSRKIGKADSHIYITKGMGVGILLTGFVNVFKY